VPAPVIPELDHLLDHRLGDGSRLVSYQGIVDGHYDAAELPLQAYAHVADINRQFPDMRPGFVDAPVVITKHLNISKAATADRRHFPRRAPAFGLELVP
jgi:hypothetical protein